MTHPRTRVVLQSRQFPASSSTACSAQSCIYYKVASSHLPAPQILRVLKLYYNFASSHLPAPQILRVLKLYYKVASSQLPAPQIALRTKVVVESRRARSPQRVAPDKTKSHSRHARSPQRVAPDKTKSHSRLHFAHPTRTISAEGCSGPEIALSPAFRALDTHDLRRGLRRTKSNRSLACISRPRHARSPQRVAPDRDKSHSRLHFVPRHARSPQRVAFRGAPAVLPPALREKVKKSER